MRVMLPSLADRRAVTYPGSKEALMELVFGGAVVAFLVLAIYGGLTGRVKGRGCCSIPDPRQDARMRGAFED